MNTFIYSRVSTDMQTVDNQLSVLTQLYPSALVIMEVISGAAKAKPALNSMVNNLQPGDKVVAYSIDRLGRSLKDLINTVETILAKGATLELYREKATYDSAMGKLMIHMQGAFAELEREMISERTKAALNARKNAGVKLGRPSTVSNEMRERVRLLAMEGASCDAIASETGLSRATSARLKAVIIREAQLAS